LRPTSKVSLSTDRAMLRLAWNPISPAQAAVTRQAVASAPPWRRPRQLVSSSVLSNRNPIAASE
jgi:hypothetical protein